MALVSIIVPCHDHAQFVGEAIASAQGQDHPTIEVVVVDDGSTDESAAVIERCAGVRLVRQQNAGLAAARNAGIRESRGDFLVFLDADDRLLPHAVSSGFRALQAEPDAAFVAGGFRRIDEAGHVTAIEPAPAIDGSPTTSMAAISACAFCMFSCSACACFIMLPMPPFIMCLASRGEGG